MLTYLSKTLFSLLNVATSSDSEPCIAIQPYLFFQEKDSIGDSDGSIDLDFCMSHSDTSCIKSMSLEMSVDLKTNVMEEIEDKYDLKFTEVYLTKFARKIAPDGTIRDEQLYTPKNVIIPNAEIRLYNFKLYFTPRAIVEDIGNEKKLCQFIAFDYLNTSMGGCETSKIIKKFKDFMKFATDQKNGYRFCIKLKSKNPGCISKNIYTTIFEVVFPDDSSLPKLEEFDQELYITGE